MKSIKVIIRSYKTKDGREFQKATCKGKYLPIARAELETNYSVIFSKKSLVAMPTKEGIWEVGFEDKGLWIDERPEVAGKNIVRVIALRVVFDKNLPVKSVEENIE